MLCTSKGKPHSKDYLVSPYGNNSLQYLTVLNCTKRNSPFCLQNHFIWPNNAGPASTVTWIHLSNVHTTILANTLQTRTVFKRYKWLQESQKYNWLDWNKASWWSKHVCPTFNTTSMLLEQGG